MPPPGLRLNGVRVKLRVGLVTQMINGHSIARTDYTELLFRFLIKINITLAV